MDTAFYIDQGNQHRSNRQYEQALQCYALAFSQDRHSAAAFNNYGNVLREMGEPQGALPFLERARTLDPNNVTTQFNLAVCLLAMGDYQRGWPAYEARWNYEHLAGTLPQFAKPRWRGEDLRGKTILVVGEQGHGDNIQFCRFLYNLHVMGAQIRLQVTDGLIPLLSRSNIIGSVSSYGSDPGEFDYWVPIMSIAGILGVTTDNLPRPVSYLNAAPEDMATWLTRLGPKKRLRVGFSWSGRRDAWLNQHKGMPIDHMIDLIQRFPQAEWINLQIDATDAEESALKDAGAVTFPGTIHSFADSAALMMHLDVIISVDTAVAHLAGALGRPTWIMLNRFAPCWRWGVDSDKTMWYSTARLFRQPEFDQWSPVIDKIQQYLGWFKV